MSFNCVGNGIFSIVIGLKSSLKVSVDDIWDKNCCIRNFDESNLIESVSYGIGIIRGLTRLCLRHKSAFMIVERLLGMKML